MAKVAASRESVRLARGNRGLVRDRGRRQRSLRGRHQRLLDDVVRHIAGDRHRRSVVARRPDEGVRPSRGDVDGAQRDRARRSLAKRDPRPVIRLGRKRDSLHREGSVSDRRKPLAEVGKALERESRRGIEGGRRPPRRLHLIDDLPIGQRSPGGGQQGTARAFRRDIPGERHFPPESTRGPDIGRHDREKLAPVGDRSGAGHRGRGLERELLGLLRRSHATDLHAAAGDRDDCPVLTGSHQFARHAGCEITLDIAGLDRGRQHREHEGRRESGPDPSSPIRHAAASSSLIPPAPDDGTDRRSRAPQPHPAAIADPTRECDESMGMGRCRAPSSGRTPGRASRSGGTRDRRPRKENARRISPPGTSPNLSVGLVEVGLEAKVAADRVVAAFRTIPQKFRADLRAGGRVVVETRRADPLIVVVVRTSLVADRAGRLEVGGRGRPPPTGSRSTTGRRRRNATRHCQRY